MALVSEVKILAAMANGKTSTDKVYFAKPNVKRCMGPELMWPNTVMCLNTWATGTHFTERQKVFIGNFQM